MCSRARATSTPWPRSSTRWIGEVLSPSWLKAAPARPWSSESWSKSACRALSGFELANALRKRGVQMTPERVSQLRAWHPDGVPEDQLATLQHRLTVRAGLRVVGGVAANE